MWRMTFLANLKHIIVYVARRPWRLAWIVIVAVAATFVNKLLQHINGVGWILTALVSLMAVILMFPALPLGELGDSGPDVRSEPPGEPQ